MKKYSSQSIDECTASILLSSSPYSPPDPQPPARRHALALSWAAAGGLRCPEREGERGLPTAAEAASGRTGSTAERQSSRSERIGLRAAGWGRRSTRTGSCVQ
ncbi:unnamed protein product [Boreogadus saida]